ncbi:MAG: ACT domain-containing protein [Schaalia hyovaginalis]|uniref:ACT domain-containing protein n=1 Tax=Schaalia hyovaginalis TaxID=29316 RepID=UPI002A920902|nr:ACT domain-containing protein [Schaalia hyovaginalis]MDY6212900.1 ACT domain-containing protein [Schaalia hyovaginalis]
MSEDQPLDRMLATLAPVPQGEYVFALVDEVPAGTDPFAVIRDEDRYTVVLEKSEAEAAGLPVDKTYAHLSLGLDANLDSIGVTATIAQVLSARSIVANAIACTRHDHFFVQADRADEAAQLLADLGKNARGWLPRP